MTFISGADYLYLADGTKMGMKETDMPSIVLTKDEHKQFTAAWREAIGYNNMHSDNVTSSVTRDYILEAARTTYKDYPELLKVVEEAFK